MSSVRVILKNSTESKLYSQAIKINPENMRVLYRIFRIRYNWPHRQNAWLRKKKEYKKRSFGLQRRSRNNAKPKAKAKHQLIFSMVLWVNFN